MKTYKFKPDANTNHESAENFFDGYGAHVTDHENGCDYRVQLVEFEWLEENEENEEIVALLLEKKAMGNEIAEELVEKAREIYDAGVELAEILESAVAAYNDGDIAACVEALNSARFTESEHGDDPASSDLRKRLILQD